MSDKINVYGKSDEEQINLNYSDVDSIYDSAYYIHFYIEEGNRGQAIKDKLDTELSGEAKDAARTVVEELVLQYEDLIANFQELYDMMGLYKEYLDNGPLSSINRKKRQDKIFINTKTLAQEISNLEEIITSNLPNALEYQDVDTDYSTLYTEISNQISSELEKEYPNYSLIEELRAKRTRLINNNNKYISLHNSILIGLEKTKSISTELEDIKNKLKKEIENYDQIWNSFVPTNNGQKEYVTTIGDVTYTNYENYFEDKISPEIMELLEKFKSGGKLVVSGGLITDDILQKINNSGLFSVENLNGKYRLSLKYDNITDWAKNNTDILENILDDAMKKGISGIYKLDPETGKYYNYDTEGNMRYFTELPEGAAKGLEHAGKILGPLGFAIDANTIYEGWKTGDPSEFGGAVGSVAGAWAGAAAVAAVDPIPGDMVVIGILAVMAGGYAGSEVGELAGEKIGEMFENEQAYWE